MGEVKKKKPKISIANDENDDWLKKIDDGRWKDEELKAIEEARKKGPKKKR